jgi:hypothetical protein
MFDSWFAMTMLAIESNNVIGLRLAKVAGGGTAALDEADLMVSEKILASSEAFNALANGACSLALINRYREIVAANADRLRSP